MHLDVKLEIMFVKPLADTWQEMRKWLALSTTSLSMGSQACAERTYQVL